MKETLDIDGLGILLSIANLLLPSCVICTSTGIVLLDMMIMSFGELLDSRRDFCHTSIFSHWFSTKEGRKGEIELEYAIFL